MWHIYFGLILIGMGVGFWFGYQFGVYWTRDAAATGLANLLRNVPPEHRDKVMETFAGPKERPR